MSPLAVSIVIITASILLSAFFSGTEIAFITANRLRLELDRKQNTFPSRIIRIFSKNPAQFITTMLIGNNIALVVYGIFMGELIIDVLFPKYINIGNIPYWLLLIQTLISTVIILFTAEFLPKTLFRIRPHFILNALATPTLFFYIIFFPLMLGTILFSKFIIKRILKYDFDEMQESKVFGKIDLTELVEFSHPKIAEDDKITKNPELKIFKNVLDFSEIKIRECIIPRTEVVAVDITKSIEELTEKFVESEFARILIYRENIDNIIGYVHSTGLFNNPKSIKSAVTPIPIVPETMQASKLLGLLNEQNKGMALVVDEFGGTSGIVTVEDILEEIVGEIEDEHDSDPMEDKKINDNEFILFGRQEIDYINEKYNLKLPKKEEFETIAGMLLHSNESIPVKNDIITIEEDYIFKILESTNIRIEKVHLTIMKKSY